MRCKRPLLLASAAFSLLAAGCGGGSPSVASLTSSTTVTTTAQTDASGLVAFSRCMRSNGVASFPDPQHFVGGNVKLTIHRLVGNSRSFQGALGACDHLLPTRGGTSQETPRQRRTRLADELSFASCMRSHGLRRFPDPTAQGDLSVELVRAQGIDVHAPAVLRVVRTCLPAAHGGLTAAKVAEALQNAHG